MANSSISLCQLQCRDGGRQNTIVTTLTLKYLNTHAHTQREKVRKKRKREPFKSKSCRVREKIIFLLVLFNPPPSKKKTKQKNNPGRQARIYVPDKFLITSIPQCQELLTFCEFHLPLLSSLSSAYQAVLLHLTEGEVCSSPCLKQKKCLFKTQIFCTKK